MLHKQTNLIILFLNCLPQTTELIAITNEARGWDEEGEREIHPRSQKVK